MVTRVVVDTSALLALCFDESGADETIIRGEDGLISAVNYSEAIAKSTDYGVPLQTVRQAIDSLNLTIVPFDDAHAIFAASLRQTTRNLNVSFADRACLGTAIIACLPVLTGDRKWEKIKCSIEVVLIR